MGVLIKGSDLCLSTGQGDLASRHVRTGNKVMPSVGLRSLVPPRGEGFRKLRWVYVNRS